MKKLLFADLDDTLFQTLPKCHADEFVAPLAFLADGSPISYARKSQLALLEMFQREMLVIPTTARNIEAFRRVHIEFRHGAILNYGGVILGPDGAPDESWHQHVRVRALSSRAGLEVWRDFVEMKAASLRFPLRIRIIADLGIPFYLVAKSQSGNEADIKEVARHCREQIAISGSQGFRIHHNGNNLAILPDWLDKRHAVRHVIAQFEAEREEIVTFGMGDSLSDMGFLYECHYSIVPSESQIARSRLSVA